MPAVEMPVRELGVRGWRTAGIITAGASKQPVACPPWSLKGFERIYEGLALFDSKITTELIFRSRRIIRH